MLGAGLVTGRRLRRGVAALALAPALVLAACTSAPEGNALLEAYLEPQRPAWPGMKLPAPVPELARGTQLVGMPTSDLRAVLGEPALVRTEGGVQYWRYSFVACTLDLFVNREADGSAEVVYFDLKASDGAGDDIDAGIDSGRAQADCERLSERLEGVERLDRAGGLPRVESF